MPLLEKAFRDERGNVSFIGIDTNDKAGAARTFLAAVRVTYPIASDPKGTLTAPYNLHGFPTTIFISPNGRIIGRHLGQFQTSTLRAALNEAFGKHDKG
jgi:hypothetical protein